MSWVSDVPSVWQQEFAVITLGKVFLLRVVGKVHSVAILHRSRQNKNLETKPSQYPAVSKLREGAQPFSFISSYLAPFPSSQPGKWVVSKLNGKRWKDEIILLNFHLHNWKLHIKVSVVSEGLTDSWILYFTVYLCEYGWDANQICLVDVVVACRCPAHRCGARGVGAGGRGAEGRQRDPGWAAGVQGSRAGDQRGTPTSGWQSTQLLQSVQSRLCPTVKKITENTSDHNLQCCISRALTVPRLIGSVHVSVNGESSSR